VQAHASGRKHAGRELPPAEVLAADHRVSWWARQLRQAGLDGCMDELRARAYLDLLLGLDSRPARQAADGSATDESGPQRRGADNSCTGGSGAGSDGPGAGDGADSGGPEDSDPDGGPGDGGPGDGGPCGGGPGPGEPRGPAPSGPLAGAVPPGFVGRLNLTVPLPTMLGLADRPGEAAGIGPVDPEANTWDRYQTGTTAEPIRATFTGRAAR
jgi:hypothetical protein